jgi:hypothetical protein
VTGAFILNAGLSKRGADAEHAAQLHGMASGTYPFVKNIPAQRFNSLLSSSEIALGAALLAPIVPASVVGTALAAFSGGLLGLYLKTPGMRQEGSLRPTQQGIPLAKDLWMLGIAASLVLDALTDRS